MFENEAEIEEFDEYLYESLLLVATEEKIEKTKKSLKTQANTSKKNFLKIYHEYIELYKEIKYINDIIFTQKQLDLNLKSNENLELILKNLNLLENIRKPLLSLKSMKQIPSNISLEFEKINKSYDGLLNSYMDRSDENGLKRFNEIAKELNNIDQLNQNIVNDWSDAFSISSNLATKSIKSFSQKCCDTNFNDIN